MSTLFKKATVIAIVASAAALTSIAPTSASAGSKSATFDVTLTIQDDCSITTQNLNFGSQGVLSDNVDGSTTLTVLCTKGTAYNVALDAGTATGSTVAARKMANSAGDASIAFNLYRDPARTEVWGETIGTDTMSGTGTGGSQTYPVLGRVPPQDTPAAGVYTSTITATVEF